MIHKKQKPSSKGLNMASLAGLVSGTILGLLFAPAKGASIRKIVGQKSAQYLIAIRKGKSLLTGTRTKTYENWTREELLEQAESAGIHDCSQMYKDELIWALRHQ